MNNDCRAGQFFEQIALAICFGGNVRGIAVLKPHHLFCTNVQVAFGGAVRIIVCVF